MDLPGFSVSPEPLRISCHPSLGSLLSSTQMHPKFLPEPPSFFSLQTAFIIKHCTYMDKDEKDETSVPTIAI